MNEEQGMDLVFWAVEVAALETKLGHAQAAYEAAYEAIYGKRARRERDG